LKFNEPDSLYYFGYCGDAEKEKLKNLDLKAKDIHFFIGPEGDFTPKEIEFMTGNKCIPVTFGATRLRTETAAIFLMSALKLILD